MKSEAERERLRQVMRERWADPEWRAKRSAETKLQHADPAFAAAREAGRKRSRTKHLEALARLHADPAFKERVSAGSRRWHGQDEKTCVQCEQPFCGSRLAKRCQRCRNSSGAWTRRIIAQLIVRDGPPCAICREEIDFALNGADQRGPTVDHLVPRGAGGGNELANLRLAHRSCNQERGLRS